MGVRDELLELEHQGWQSLCDGTGADFYGNLLTEDGVMVLAHGKVFGRQEVVDSLREAPPWRDYEIDDVRLVEAGGSAAALVYRGTGYDEGTEPAFVALMSSLCVRRGAGWALAAYQQTPVPD